MRWMQYKFTYFVDGNFTKLNKRMNIAFNLENESMIPTYIAHFIIISA